MPTTKDYSLYFQDGLDKIFLTHCTLTANSTDEASFIACDQIYSLIKNKPNIFGQNTIIKNLFPENIDTWPEEYIDEKLEPFFVEPCNDFHLTLI